MAHNAPAFLIFRNIIIVFLKEKFVKILCTKRRKDWTNPAEAVSIKGKNKKGDTSDGISNEGIRRGTAARDDGNMERRRGGGNQLPGDKALSEKEALKMFREQASTVCATLNGEVVGVYILHPNNFGRCGHIANASYAVRKDCRGEGIGRKMVRHCLRTQGKRGFAGSSLTL